MKTSNFAIELAEQRVEHEAAVSVARVQSTLKRRGRSDCCDCGDEIEAARRHAAPFATRCISCQAAFERHSRGR